MLFEIDSVKLNRSPMQGFDFKCSGQPYATKVLGAIVLISIKEQKLWHIYLRQKDVEHLNSHNCAGAEFQKFIGLRF